MKILRIVVALVALGCPAATAATDRGVAELMLDRGAVRALIAAGLPAPLRLEAPVLGPLTLRLDPPGAVEFHEGGVNVRVRLTLVEAGMSVELLARYLPEVDPLTGVFRFAPESVVPDTPLPVDVDLAAWLDAVELPRGFDWDLRLADGRSPGLRCSLQSVEVLDDRLRIELGLVFE